ncbi:hypothetical protein EV189_1338 [Motilibacter rhizosphaerae]|uniref:PspA-associated domain-containing protein n=1 Tax=Motilibacter rhizosphaerae TaxID=598652 RepID=A0A4Q7NRA7_9ACTN|nr:hypothetical protein [Motilibacter rhizosphaerae]RZS89571.1 hypothetical protein EV189_1338 [Motilibacter rhizosphaerae]
MIIRVLHEGQFEVDTAAVDELNRLDDALQGAVDGEDDGAFSAAVRALAERVRSVGTPLPLDDLRPSDAVVPHPDATREEVRGLLHEDGVIPG